MEPKCGSAWHSWALLESRRCKFERAAELFKQGIEHDGNNAALLASWASMEGKELGNITRSRDLFQQAVAADPYFSPAWHSWGCVAGSLEKARELFQKAAEVRPDDASPRHTLGVLESEKGDGNEKAMQHWKKAIEVSSGHALSYQCWALMEGKANNMEEARRLFQCGIDWCLQTALQLELLCNSLSVASKWLFRLVVKHSLRKTGSDGRTIHS